MTDVLSIRNLSVDFTTPRGVVHAVRQVNLAVQRNKTVGIVGESGCGKSTVVSTILRLLQSNASIPTGEVLLNGADVLLLSNDGLRAIRGSHAAMIFQDPMTSQNPVISIADQMIDIQYREPRLGRKQKRKRAIDMLKRVGIADPAKRIDDFPHQFSGGMRQRISIAMALLVGPELLIADEPTTALDVNTEAQIIFLLRDLQRESGAGMLFVSHNLGLIAELCDDVLVMYAGEVVEQGSVRDLFHEPKHPYTQKLLECDPAHVLKRTQHLPTIPGRVPDLRKVPPGCVFAPRCHKTFEPCETERPELHRLSGSNLARCHLWAVSKTLSRVDDLRSRTGINTEALAAAPRSSTPLLEVDRLKVRFRTDGTLKALVTGNADPYLDAVADVSLTLHEGETYGLVGESGSGKTSLGRAIVGLTKPTSGSIRFDGVDLVELSSSQYNAQRRKIAMMFQDPVASLSPRRTSRSLVMEPFEIHRVPLSDGAETAEKLFSMVGLTAAFFGRYPHELSGGQARRIGVARALALSPALVVADEPTAGLDVSVQGEILNLMAELQRREGLSYLVISHNLPAIRHISDRIGVMYLGRLVEQGSAADVFERPAHPYTKALLESIPNPDPDRRREVLSIEGEVPSLNDRPRGCEFHPRCTVAQDRCRLEAPEELEIAGRHRVRCHFPLG